MKILIVGSKGFIGSHCVDFFSQEHEVWECDVVMDYDNPHSFQHKALSYHSLPQTLPYDLRGTL